MWHILMNQNGDLALISPTRDGRTQMATRLLDRGACIDRADQVETSCYQILLGKYGE